MVHRRRAVRLGRAGPEEADKPLEGRTTEQILDAAREAGAVQGAAEDLDPRAAAGGSRAGRTHAAAFTGGGRRLGDAADEPAGGSSDLCRRTPPPPPPRRGPRRPPAPAPVAHTIAFYANGFVVDDGPLRALDDPANIPFMNAIAKGECPRELPPPRPDTPININLVRKDGDYEPPPEPKYVAFGGSGRTPGGEGAGGHRRGRGLPTATKVRAESAAGPRRRRRIGSSTTRRRRRRFSCACATGREWWRSST